MKTARTLPIARFWQGGAETFARFIVAGVAVVALSACMSMLAGGSSSTETGDQVALSGRVTGGSGDGVSGVIVTLQGTPLADTTDITGTYLISGRVAASAVNTTDTLRFHLNGQTVAKKTVTARIATVTEIQIVQRGFSGSFSGVTTGITRIEGVVTGDGIAPGDSISATFYFNALSNNYSGFIWFPPPSTTVLQYVIHVNVYGAGDVFKGRSQAVPFTSQAGNITIPDFHPSRPFELIAPSSQDRAHLSTRSSL